MNTRLLFAALICCFFPLAGSSRGDEPSATAVADSPANPKAAADSPTPAHHGDAATAGEGIEAAGTATSPVDTGASTGDATMFTAWDFEIEVVARQHEPARKNRDQFHAKLRFGAVLPHASKEAHRWTGFGRMDARVLSRAAGSFQAPHKPAQKFNLLADTFWDQPSHKIAVIVMPRDAVTYSLTTGEVLGTVGILETMLADATSAELDGTVLKFVLPEGIATPAEFHCKFDTSGKHVCWFEGTAILRVLGRRVGKSLPAEKLPETDANGNASVLRDAEQAAR